MARPSLWLGLLSDVAPSSGSLAAWAGAARVPDPAAGAIHRRKHLAYLRLAQVLTFARPISGNVAAIEPRVGWARRRLEGARRAGRGARVRLLERAICWNLRRR